MENSWFGLDDAGGIFDDFAFGEGGIQDLGGDSPPPQPSEGEEEPFSLWAEGLDLGLPGWEEAGLSADFEPMAPPAPVEEMESTPTGGDSSGGGGTPDSMELSDTPPPGALVFIDEAEAIRRRMEKTKNRQSPPSSPNKRKRTAGEVSGAKKKARLETQDPAWLSLLSPQTTDVLGWMLEVSNDLWDQIDKTMRLTGRVLPDAHVMATLAQSNPRAFAALSQYGAVWQLMLNLDIMGVASYMGGSNDTFVDVGRLMTTMGRLCVPLYGRLYMKKGSFNAINTIQAPEVYMWRYWKILLEMRRRVRSNWSRARWLVPLPAPNVHPTPLRPFTRIGIEQGPRTTRPFHHEQLCFITRDEFPWPVVICGDKIGFATTATTFVFHRLAYPVYGARHRSANMAFVILDALVLFVAICNISGKGPGLVAQAFNVEGLLALATSSPGRLFGRETISTPTLLEYPLPEQERRGTFVIMHDLYVDQWPKELSKGRLSAPGHPIVPVSIMATAEVLALAYPDGILHMRWAVPDRATFLANGGGTLYMSSVQFVPWRTFAPVLGDRAAQIIMKPLAEGVPVTYPVNKRSSLHVPDDAFFCPLRPAGETWIDLPILSAVPGQARNTAILTLWRQTEQANGFPFAHIRTVQQQRWDNLQMEGVITGLVVRFYEAADDNVDGMRDITPEIRAKVVAFARPHRLANVDTPFMQANVSGVAIVDAPGLEGKMRTTVTLLPWPAIRDGTLASYPATLRADLLVYPEERFPNVRASWFFETDAITIVQCVPEKNILSKEGALFTVCLRTILLGEYAKGQTIHDGEFSRMLHKNVSGHSLTPGEMLVYTGYAKGSLVLLAHQEAPQVCHTYLALSVLEGPPIRTQPEDTKKGSGHSRPFMLTSAHM